MPDIKINPADFEAAENLKNAVLKELGASGIDIDGVSFDSEIEVSSFLNTALKAASSQDIQAALYACLIRCTFEGEKITKDTFEPVENREHYYPIMLECLKVNLTPFFKGLISQFKGADFTALLKNTTIQK